MKVIFSKDFKKTAQRQSGKVLKSLQSVVLEVQEAKSIEEITDLKKLVGYNNVYRIRIGSLRAFFTLHIEIEGDTVFFRYLVNRGEAYSKEMEQNLRRVDE